MWILIQIIHIHIERLHSSLVVFEAQDLCIFVYGHISIAPLCPEQVRVRARSDPLPCDARHADDEPRHRRQCSDNTGVASVRWPRVAR